MDRADDQESVSLLHELDLGRHTLVLLSDGSMDLLANQEQTPDLAETGLHLDSDETYRLFISLHEQFKHTDAYRGDERASELTDSSTLVKKMTMRKLFRLRTYDVTVQED